MTYCLDTAVETELIKLEKHQPLLDDLTHFCERAGITEEVFFTPLSFETCGVPPKAIKYFLHYRRLRAAECYGLVFLGSQKKVPRMMACMIGAMLRNYVDATLCTLETAISESVRYRSVLAIPDFYLQEPNSWRSDKMLTLLVEREAKQLQTIVGIAGELEPTPVMLSLLSNYVTVER